MTATDLRTGAALVRALIDGDDSARWPLSDWIAENGLPGRDHRDSQAAVQRLRLYDGAATRTRPRLCPPGEVPCYYLCADGHCSLGTWPAWAWEPLALVEE